MRRASAIECTSPLPVTGTETASTTSRMIAHGALPVKRCERVRGCTVIASTPSASAIWATSTAFRCSSSQPPRILTVSGTLTALRSARRISEVAAHVAHEGRALALAGDLGHGAAHVEVHDVGAQDLAALGGPRELVGILAQELHGERPLSGIVGGDGVGVRVPGQERGGVHLLRGGEPAAALPRDEPEGRVGDAGHGGQAGQRGDLDGADLHGRLSIRAQGRRGPAHRPRWCSRASAASLRNISAWRTLGGIVRTAA